MKKIKEFSKKYLIGFFIGLILFTVVGVSAAAVFPSNQTTYNNGATGMSATNVQTAIDELYNTCFPPTAGDSILDSADIVTSGDGLYKDEYEDRYFYRGANPNNYITFNNETWRIVSIESDGTIKIIRTASIGNLAWDSSNSNNWARPASLNTYLNGTYYNELNSTAQNQIVAKEWSIGSVNYDNSNLAAQINDENGTKWNGKVALVTVSEYLRSNSNQSSCGLFSLNIDNYMNCRNTTWMYASGHTWWTLSPRTDFYSYAIYVDTSGYGDYYVNNNHTVFPSVYLSSEVKITGGDGSQSNPYTLSP